MGRSTHALPGGPRVLKSDTIVLDVDEHAILTTGPELRQALDAAYAAGRAEGHAVGVSERDRLAAAAAERLHAVAASIGAEVTTAASLDAAALLEVARALAEWFVGHTVAEAPEQLAEQVLRAAASLEGERPVRLTVGPAIAALVRDHASSELIDAIVVDPTIGPADFGISTPGPQLQRFWEEAIGRAIAALAGLDA